MLLYEQAQMLKTWHSIECYNVENPFMIKSSLKSLVPSHSIPPYAKSIILYFTEKSNVCFEEFICDRAVHISTVCMRSNGKTIAKYSYQVHWIDDGRLSWA